MFQVIAERRTHRSKRDVIRMELTTGGVKASRVSGERSRMTIKTILLKTMKSLASERSEDEMRTCLKIGSRLGSPKSRSNQAVAVAIESILFYMLVDQLKNAHKFISILDPNRTLDQFVITVQGRRRGSLIV